MELTQIARRIFMQHWRLIAVCILIPVVAVAVIEGRHARTYTATARLALDTPDPTTRQEAATVGDTAKALATSPGRVAYALKQARITGRDPDQVASNDVSVSVLGSSGLVQLSVTDRDPRVAASIANALTQVIIQTRADINDRVGAVADIATRIGDLEKKIMATDTSIAAINGQLAGRPTAASQLRARRDALAQTRDALVSEQGVLQSERAGIVTAVSTRPKAVVVSAATPPSSPDPSKLSVDIVLAVLLGLIGGVALAAMKETVRPTVIGSDAVAQEFDAPLLGTLGSTPDDEVALADLGRLHTRFSLAARSAMVPSIGLVGTSSSIDLRPLAARLDTPEHSPALRTGTLFPDGHQGPPQMTTVAVEPEKHASAQMRVVAAAPGGAPSHNGRGLGGVVVVSPSSVRMAEVQETQHLLRIMSAPLLGIVTYPQPKRHRRRRPRFGR